MMTPLNKFTISWYHSAVCELKDRLEQSTCIEHTLAPPFLSKIKHRIINETKTKWKVQRHWCQSFMFGPFMGDCSTRRHFQKHRTNKRNMLYQTMHIQHTENKRLEMIWFGCYMKRLPIVNPHHVQLITLHAFVKINAYNAVIRALY